MFSMSYSKKFRRYTLSMLSDPTVPYSGFYAQASITTLNTLNSMQLCNFSKFIWAPIKNGWHLKGSKAHLFTRLPHQKPSYTSSRKRSLAEKIERLREQILRIEVKSCNHLLKIEKAANMHEKCWRSQDPSHHAYLPMSCSLCFLR